MGQKTRIDALERASRELTERLARVEAQLGGHVPPADVSVASLSSPPPLQPTPGVVSARPAQTPTFTRPDDLPSPLDMAAAAFRRSRAAATRPSLEDLLAGRVLAWAGGVAVLVGIVLLFAIAISRGWIGESARTLLGASVSCALIAGGSWLHERRGRTEASLAAAAAGLAGLFVTCVVSARVYELIPVELGTLLVLGTGALATVLALRWHAQGVAALGLIGGLLAPVAVGAPHDGATICILFAAAVSAVALCVRERWEWVALVTWLCVTPQWVTYLLLRGEVSTGPALLTLIGFGVLTAASAVGLEPLRKAQTVWSASALLLALNSFIMAVAGSAVFDRHIDEWLVSLAAAHLAVAVMLLRRARASRAVGIMAAVIGVVLADIVLARLLDGPALTVSWAAGALGFAALARRAQARARAGDLGEGAAGVGLAAHIALALIQSVSTVAPPDAVLAGEAVSGAAAGSLAALAAACLAAGFVVRRRTWRLGLHGIGLAAVAYLLAAELDGAPLVAAWAGEAAALAHFARRSPDRIFVVRAAFAHLGLAVIHALVVEAPPSALFDGLTNPLAAAVALGACALAAAQCAVIANRGADSAPAAAAGDESVAAPVDGDPVRVLVLPAAATAGLLALHLASTQLVTAAGAGAQAQTLLSVMWGAIGVIALITGLVRDVAPLRTAALALLLVALVKVFGYDLAALTPIARVVSFIVLGLLLLLGAFAWQRIRPRAHPDPRETAPAPRE